MCHIPILWIVIGFCSNQVPSTGSIGEFRIVYIRNSGYVSLSTGYFEQFVYLLIVLVMRMHLWVVIFGYWVSIYFLLANFFLPFPVIAMCDLLRLRSSSIGFPVFLIDLNAVFLDNISFFCPFYDTCLIPLDEKMCTVSRSQYLKVPSLSRQWMDYIKC